MTRFAFMIGSGQKRYSDKPQHAKAKFMITQRHLELYREYAGDGDAFVRFAKPEEHALMSHNEWMLIGDLLQDVELLGGELVSDSFAESARHRLKELCDADVTITMLKDLASRPGV